MRTEDLKLIEDYLDEKLDEEALNIFKSRLNEEPELVMEVKKHKLFIAQLKKTGERKKLQNKLDVFHDELSEKDLRYIAPRDRQIQLFWKNHYSTMAVAASVAIITVVSILFGLEYIKSGNKQYAYYKELKRDVERLRKTQNDIINSLDENIQAPNIGATAFVVAKNGYLLTSYHAVKGADSLVVENEKYKRLKAKLVYADPVKDLALIRVSDKRFKGFREIPLAITDKKARLGEKVFTLGYSKEDIVYGEGAISSATGYDGEISSWQISVPVNPGNSGSPLLDNRGNVIGMISGKHIRDDGASFAIKPGYLLGFIASAPKDSVSGMRLNKVNRIYSDSRPAQVSMIKDYILMLKVYKE